MLPNLLQFVCTHLYFNRLSGFPEVGMSRAQLIYLSQSCRNSNFRSENWQSNLQIVRVKFIFSKKATKIDEIFTVALTFTTLRQINGEGKTG